MYLESVNVTNFRNLGSVDLGFSPGINWFFGANGSGKTSLLEALYHLGYGRSFRSREVRKLINNGFNEFLVFASASSIGEGESHRKVKLGISKNLAGDYVLKVNGSNVYGYSDLVKFCPIQLFSPDCVDRLLGSPSSRRMCFDWFMFHVEPTYGVLSSKLRKVVKQRNSLLKARMPDSVQFRFWDDQLCDLSSEISPLRSKHFERFKRLLFEELSQFGLFNIDLRVSLFLGWSADADLSMCLRKHHDRDMKYGTTSCGAHKYDIRFSIDNRSVFDVWSRGMLRVLVSSVQLALCRLLFEVANKSSICLVDDITAELDFHNQITLLERIESTNFQAFITQISENDGAFKTYYSSTSEPKKGKMFHVKQGSITEETT